MTEFEKITEESFLKNEKEKHLKFLKELNDFTDFGASLFHREDLSFWDEETCQVVKYLNNKSEISEDEAKTIIQKYCDKVPINYPISYALINVLAKMENPPCHISYLIPPKSKQAEKEMYRFSSCIRYLEQKSKRKMDEIPYKTVSDILDEYGTEIYKYIKLKYFSSKVGLFGNNGEKVKGNYENFGFSDETFSNIQRYFINKVQNKQLNTLTFDTLHLFEFCFLATDNEMFCNLVLSLPDCPNVVKSAIASNTNISKELRNSVFDETNPFSVKNYTDEMKQKTYDSLASSLFETSKENFPTLSNYQSFISECAGKFYDFIITGGLTFSTQVDFFNRIFTEKDSEWVTKDYFSHHMIIFKEVKNLTNFAFRSAKKNDYLLSVMPKLKLNDNFNILLITNTFAANQNLSSPIYDGFLVYKYLPFVIDIFKNKYPDLTISKSAILSGLTFMANKYRFSSDFYEQIPKLYRAVQHNIHNDKFVQEGLRENLSNLLVSLARNPYITKENAIFLENFINKECQKQEGDTEINRLANIKALLKVNEKLKDFFADTGFCFFGLSSEKYNKEIEENVKERTPLLRILAVSPMCSFKNDIIKLYDKIKNTYDRKNILTYSDINGYQSFCFQRMPISLSDEMKRITGVSPETLQKYIKVLESVLSENKDLDTATKSLLEQTLFFVKTEFALRNSYIDIGNGKTLKYSDYDCMSHCNLTWLLTEANRDKESSSDNISAFYTGDIAYANYKLYCEIDDKAKDFLDVRKYIKNERINTSKNKDLVKGGNGNEKEL